MSAGVAFRRIHGRIIPIIMGAAKAARSQGANAAKIVKAGTKVSVEYAKKNPGDAFKVAAAGGIFGGMLGGYAATRVNRKQLPKIKEEMQKSPQVDSRKFVKKTMPDVKVLTSTKDLYKDKHMTPWEKMVLTPHMRSVEQGDNAFALRLRGKDYVAVQKRAREGVVGHELGHIKQYQAGKRPSTFFPRLLGGQARFEKDAWKRSPSSDKNNTLQKRTYGTYKRARDYVRIGTAAGAAASVFAVARKAL
jgi:hypothetical protein